MLDLDTRVHLEEVEPTLRVHQELDGPGAHVVDRPRCLHGDRAHGLARLGVDRERGGLLDHLLMPALDRALALVEVNDVALRVAQHLDLDVARLENGLLDVDPIVTERRFRLRTCRAESAREIARPLDEPHSLAAAAARSFQEDGEPDLGGQACHLCLGGDGLLRAGNDRHAGAAHEPARLELVPHGGDRLGRWPDEHQARGPACLGEGAPLGEEAVAGMDRLGARGLGDGEELLDREVALGGRRRADRIGSIRLPDVEGRAVRLRVDRHRLDPELAAGADDPHRDLAAVRDQDAAEERPAGALRGGCCHASSAGSGRACSRASRARRSAAAACPRDG